MPKLRCVCGYIHNLSVIPDAGYVVIKDSDYEKLVQCESSLNNAKSTDEKDDLIYRITEMQFRMYSCPDCHRLALFKNADSVEFYSPE